MNLIRQDIAAMQAYAPGEQPQGGTFIKLNTNENPYPPARGVAAAVAEAAQKLSLYSDPLSTALRDKAAEIYNLPSRDWVVAGNGSDDVLNILVRMCAQKGETVASFNPSYSLYITLAEIQAAKFLPIEFEPDYSLPKQLPLDGVKLLFLANPNSPSGTAVPESEVRRLCESCRGVVVVDEAYADFAEWSAVPLLREYENLVVTRTFSKSYSLAGGRLGLAMANPHLIENMLKVKDSYNLDCLTQAAGLAALTDQENLRCNCERIKATRARLIKELERDGFYVYPSQANFVLARAPAGKSAKALYSGLKAQNIFVRYFDRPRLDDCLRISVGTDAETDAMLKALRGLLAQ